MKLENRKGIKNSKASYFHLNMDPSFIFLIVAVLIGGYIRLFQVLKSPFPLNDGGLFYSMTRDLIENGFHLPNTISYNNLNLPYAYPPLSFYMAGGLSYLVGWRLLDIIRILPAIFSVLSIPVFYLFAREFCQSEDERVLAVFAFALLPASFDWSIMGGGLTRSISFFFSLLTLFMIYRLYNSRENHYIFWTALFSALTILTHPERALQTAVSALVFFVFFGRNRSGVIKSLAVAFLTLVFTLPWFVSVISRFGLDPFLAAGQTSLFGVLNIFQLTHESGLQTIAALALLGFFWNLADRKYFLPVWFLVLLIVEPRSAPLFLAPCVAIFAGYALTRIFRSFDRSRSVESKSIDLFSSLVSKIAFAFILFLWIYSSFSMTVFISENNSLSNGDQKAFTWVEENTPPNSIFLVLTGQDPLTDPIVEWFPAITMRENVSTIQGYEWDGTQDFNGLLEDRSKLQSCIYQAVGCVESWLMKNDLKVNYILVRLKNTSFSDEYTAADSSFVALMVESGDYQIAYQQDEIVILKAE